MQLSIFIFLGCLIMHGDLKGWQKITTPKVQVMPSLPPATPSTAPRSCGKVKIPSSRVISGEDAIHGAWPWQASIYFRDSFLICGGVLVSPIHVLTAAHCFTSIPKFFIFPWINVVLGDHTLSGREHTEQRFKISKYAIHDKYYPFSNSNDIALITLDRPAIFNNFIQPACTPAHKELTKPNRTCYVTGWGRSNVSSGDASTNVLQQSPLNILSHAECVKQNNKPNEGSIITSGMFCAAVTNPSLKTNSACHGDSGGPLVCKDSDGSWTVNGIVSWGSITCNTTDAYTVFTKVSEYIAWVAFKITVPQQTVIS